MRVVYSWILCLFVVMLTSSVNAAGFLEIKENDLEIGVWYPSDDVNTKQRLGPFEVHFAQNGRPKAGKFPIVVFSHGNGGRHRNHYLTLRQLADAGFVVVAPDHTSDYLIGGRKTAAALELRVRELKESLQALSQNTILQPHLSDDPVSGLGYSLGAATILLAAGGEFNIEIVTQHCKAFGEQDREFCEDPGGGPPIFKIFWKIARPSRHWQ